MKLLKNIWTWVIGILGLLLLIIKGLSSKNNALQAEVNLAGDKAKDKEIQAKRDALDKEYKSLEEKRKELIKKDPSLANLSPEEIEAYWKNR